MDLPEDLKRYAWHRAIKAAKDASRELGWHQVADALEQLTSDPELQDALSLAIERGRRRFLQEHLEVGREVVELVSNDDFFQSEAVLGPLSALVLEPGAFNPEEKQRLTQAMSKAMPQSVPDEDVAQWVWDLVGCIARELMSLPGVDRIRGAYMLQLQAATASDFRKIAHLSELQARQVERLIAPLQAGQLLPQLEAARPRPYHNVPQPDFKRLVGREEELRRLRKVLHPDDRQFQIALLGVGGVGKSALAQAIAMEFVEQYDQLEERERYDAIIWASAKEEVLTAYGREPASATGSGVRTLEHVYSRLAAVLEKESITTASPASQGDVVRTVLQSQRCLLILDNFESVTDERIRPFLRNLPAPTKVIITSREGFDGADLVRLSGLDEKAAAELANEEAERSDVNLTLQQQVALFAVTHGIPLAIRLGVARYAHGEAFDAVVRWIGDAHGDITDYCISGQVQLAYQRNGHARAVLLACSLFNMDCGTAPTALADIADISRFDLEEATSVLVRLLLLQVDQSDRYRMLPIIQRYARTQFTAHAPDDMGLVERWLGWHLKLAEQVTGGELDTGGDEILDAEYPNVAAAARWCHETQRWSELYALASASWSYAYTHSLFIDRTQSANAVGDVDELLSMALTAGSALGDARR